MQVHGFHHGLVTLSAGGIRNFRIMGLDPQRLVKPPCGECERVPETVRSLGRVFGKEAGGRVAIVTDRDTLVAPFHPGFVVRSHDMTICTGGRIIRQVRAAPSIEEGENRNSSDTSHQGGKNTQAPGWILHGFLILNNAPPNHKTFSTADRLLDSPS